jgi:hypothetical protein
MTASFPCAHVFTVELSLILLQFKINLKVVTNEKGEASGAVLAIRY